MSVKSNNTYFHLGAAFMVLSIAASTFLLAIIWETSANNNASNNRYYDNFNSNFQDLISRNMISICCTWGEDFADGELTFMIRDDNDNDNNQDSVSIQNKESTVPKNEAVYNAIEEWDQRIEGLTFREVQNRYDDRYGLITKSFVTIYEWGFPFEFSKDQTEQIAKHEIGHVLGLGHANFDNTLMATRVQYGSGTISECEILAVYEANHWKLTHEEWDKINL
ncbi:MAG TPA: matrixin family metalloprotease [Nitrososphaeraceae archaeon]|nr:matrixin family metalloprotease [Nitrososphaeraceae archaeon]